MGKLPAEVSFVRVNAPPAPSPPPPTQTPHAPPQRTGRPLGPQRKPQRSAKFRPGGSPSCWAPGHLTPPTPPRSAPPQATLPPAPLQRSIRAQATGARGLGAARAVSAGAGQSGGRKPTWPAIPAAHCSACGPAVNHGVPGLGLTPAFPVPFGSWERISEWLNLNIWGM